MRSVRSVAAMAVLGAAALLLGVSPAGAASTAVRPATSPPAAPPVARTRGPHVMPMRANPAAARSAVVAAAAPVGSHLNYYGGRVVSHTEVVQVLWGAGSAGGSTGQYLSQVLSTASPSVATFYQGVLNSSYVDWLSEYPTPTQSIGRGSFAAQYTVTPSTSATTISDTTIQSELLAQIGQGHLPAPHQDAAGNNNTYYAIFFPHGKKITLGTSSSCVGGGFVAYHGTIAPTGKPEIYYGVHPDMQTGSGCEGQGNTGTDFGNVTAVASHELVEMMTDPEVGIAASVGPPLAWYDPTNGEIGDICNAMPGTTTGSDGLTYSVQTEWSNAQGACIVGAPAHDFSLAAPPVTVLAGTSGSSSVTSTVVTGTAETVALTVTGLPTGVTAAFSPTSVLAGGGSTLTVNVGAAVAAGSYPLTVKGTAPSVTHTTTLALTVTRAPVVTSAASTTFTAGTAGTFTVTTTGSPTASLAESGALPSGISFTDKGNGTATIAGTTPTGGSYPITISAHNGAAADATQAFTLVVNKGAAITSAVSTTFGLGVSGTFAVTATGFPAPALAETGPLPAGVTLTDNGNGSATLAGTPSAGSEGVYPVTITATNGVGAPASQPFTVTVTRQAAITSAAAATFVAGSVGSFAVTTVGVPKASISRTGTLPTGVTFVDNGNGTATLSGTPAADQAGSFPLTLTAHNGIGPDTVQSFLLRVEPVGVVTTPPSVVVPSATVSTAIGDPVTYTVHAGGVPVPTLSTSSVLPAGLTLVDHGDGTATLSGVPSPGTAGSYTVVVDAANGVGSSVVETITVVVARRATVLRYDGATSGTYAGGVPISATLVDAVTGAPVGARTVHLALGTQGVDAVTAGPTGTAAAALTLTQASGTVALSAAFDGDASYAGSSVAVPAGFVIARRAAVVTTGPGYVRQITVVRGAAAALTVRAGVRRPSDAPAGDLASVASVRVRLVPIGGGTTRSCVSTPGSRTSPLTRTSAGGWNVACRFPAGLPLGVYEVVVSLGANGFWSGRAADVLLVTSAATSGAHGSGVLAGAGLPARSSVAFAFTAQRAGRGGRSIVGSVVSVLSVTDPDSGVVAQHVLTSRTVTALTVRTRRAPYTAVLSGSGRWDSSAVARFSLAASDTTGGVRDGDRYGQTIAPPAAATSGVVGLLRLRAVVVRSGDIAVR